jgi:outer membrane protein
MPSVLLLILLVALPLSAAAEPPPSKRVLTLEAALATAQSNSPVLRGAVAQTDAAEARKDRARATLLPQLTGNATYQRTNFVARQAQVGNPTAAAGNETFFNLYQVGVTASMVLYDFNGSIDRFRSAKETRRAFEERQRASALNVEFAVRQAFFQARARRELVDVAREALNNNQRHVEQIQAFVEVGSRPEIDLRQVRTDLANARVAVVQAENDENIAKVTLQQAMGIEESYDFQVADEHLAELPFEKASLDELMREAIATRPDVLALQRDLRASTLTETATRGAFGPVISASGTVAKSWLDGEELRLTMNGGVGLSWPLIRSGATLAERREARANTRRVDASVTELRQTVRLQVEQARLAVQAAVAVLDAAGEAAENARARLGLAEGRYEAGVGNAIELGDAQVAFTQAEAQSVSAEYSLSVARAQLLSALGRSR